MGDQLPLRSTHHFGTLSYISFWYQIHIVNLFWYQKSQKVWPSTDLLEASTNYAMWVDILRMEIGEIILLNQAHDGLPSAQVRRHICWRRCRCKTTIWTSVHKVGFALKQCINEDICIFLHFTRNKFCCLFKVFSHPKRSWLGKKQPYVQVTPPNFHAICLKTSKFPF